MSYTKQTMKMAKDKTLEEVAAQAQASITTAENGDSVHSALLAIQLGLKAPKDQVNNFAHFNYRTAGQILERVKPFLAETGCTLTDTDEMIMLGNRYYVHCRVTLRHIMTGEEISVDGYAREAEAEKGKMDAQLTGSASTFAKKYALCNLFAIDDSAEDPDITSGQPSGDRVQQAVMALGSAQNRNEVETIKSYFADVMGNAQVIEVGKQAKTRLGY